jgi:hypothetical protein
MDIQLLCLTPWRSKHIENTICVRDEFLMYSNYDRLLLRLEAEAIEVDQASITPNVRFDRQCVNSGCRIGAQEPTQLRLSYWVTGTGAVVDADLRQNVHGPLFIATFGADDEAYSTASWEHRKMNCDRKNYPSFLRK